MKITVFCKPSAKIEKIEKVDELHYRVAVSAAPEEGAANQAVREALAKHFEVPVSAVTILSGQQSRKKLIAVKS